MTAKTRKPRRKGGGPRSEWNGPRALVLIDQAPLRNDATAQCRREMNRLEKARTEWRHFEQQDKPAFARWMAATFGALLTELRENGSQIAEKERLIEEVELEMMLRGWKSYARAYAEIQRRRDEPPGAGEPPPAADASAADEDARGPRFSDSSAPPSEFEQEVLFEEFASVFLGINVDRLSDREYERMFREFRRQFFKEPAGAGPKGAGAALDSVAPAPKARDARIKEIYRTLVRRLHPDTRADADPEVSAIWHDVQEAYERGDLKRLEMLLALTDIQGQTTGEHTTLFQIRSVLAELRRAFRALQRSLRAARRELAWNFVRRADRAVLERKLRKQMEYDLANQRTQLAELETFIASWSRPRRRAKRRPVDRPEMF